MQLKANKCTFWAMWHGIFLISPCLMYSDPITLTVHLRADSTSYACNTHRPAARTQELKSIYSVFSHCASSIILVHLFFFWLSLFPLHFLLQSPHLWLPAERGVEKVNFSVGLICYAWPVSVSTCPSFDTGWQSAWFICPGAVSQTASHGHCSQHRDTPEHQANQSQVTHDKLWGDTHSFFS